MERPVSVKAVAAESAMEATRVSDHVTPDESRR